MGKDYNYGGGVSVRSFIHIQDVVRATLQIMKESSLDQYIIYLPMNW